MLPWCVAPYILHHDPPDWLENPTPAPPELRVILAAEKRSVFSLGFWSVLRSNSGSITDCALKDSRLSVVRHSKSIEAVIFSR